MRPEAGVRTIRAAGGWDASWMRAPPRAGTARRTRSRRRGAIPATARADKEGADFRGFVVGDLAFICLQADSPAPVLPRC